MANYLLTAIYLAGTLAYMFLFPNQSDFPSCDREDTEYFAYTQDHRRAVKICMEIDGWRFNYGSVKDHSDIVTFYLPKDEIDNLKWKNEYGIIVANYAILTDPNGVTRLRVNSEIMPIGHWVADEILDDTSATHTNNFYDKKVTNIMR